MNEPRSPNNWIGDPSGDHRYEIQFDIAPVEAIDQLALRVRQPSNRGNAGDWFDEFRGGIFAFYARLHGVRRLYVEMHAWQPRQRLGSDLEYELASILFQMDSALECLVYALNALGWALSPSDFRDVTSRDDLKRVSPTDVTLPPTSPSRKRSQVNYGNIFSAFQRTWTSNSELIERIRELHDVSKHRRTLFTAGQGRLDPPPGFFEHLGIGTDSPLRTLLTPMAETLLKDDPRAPASLRPTPRPRPCERLEDLVPAFVGLVRDLGVAALADLRQVCPAITP